MEIKQVVHAAESGHFYDRDGFQIATVPNAKGDKQITPTLVHARKLDLARGCTSIIKLAAAPALVVWMQKQAVLSALTLPRLDTEGEDAWLARVYEDAKQTAARAAAKGTEIHAAVQRHYAAHGGITDLSLMPNVDAILKCIDTAFASEVSWNVRSEVSFSSTLGYGAKLDLLVDTGSGPFIIDLKGKDSPAEVAKAELYADHWEQLAAQRHAAKVPDAACGILFFSRTEPAAKLLWATPDQLVRGMAMFKGLLAYSFAKDNFKPSWAQEEA